jgi:hypothetical protein
MHAQQVRYWNLLSEADQEILAEIRVALSAPTLQSKRNRRLSDLREIIDSLKIFQFSTPEDTWKRLLVTGFVELEDALAINVTQLHKLIFKSKSSINGSLRRMGYSIKQNPTAELDKLFEFIPALRRSATELRQWTIREKSEPIADATSCEEQSSDTEQELDPFLFAFDGTYTSLFD